MSKRKENMTDIPESEAVKFTCPLLQHKCVGSRCASCIITGVTEAETPEEVENLVTCNNPNVNKSAEISEFRKELMDHVKMTNKYFDLAPIRIPKKKKAAKKKKK